MDTTLLKGLLKKYLEMVEEVENREEYFKKGVRYPGMFKRGYYVPLKADFDRVGKLLRKEMVTYEQRPAPGRQIERSTDDETIF